METVHVILVVSGPSKGLIEFYLSISNQVAGTHQVNWSCRKYRKTLCWLGFCSRDILRFQGHMKGSQNRSQKPYSSVSTRAEECTGFSFFPKRAFRDYTHHELQPRTNQAVAFVRWQPAAARASNHFAGTATTEADGWAGTRAVRVQPRVLLLRVLLFQPWRSLVLALMNVTAHAQPPRFLQAGSSRRCSLPLPVSRPARVQAHASGARRASSVPAAH